MSFWSKIGQFCKDYTVTISTLSLLIGVHWSWHKLQDIPELVHPSEKKEFPLIRGAKYLASTVLDKFTNQPNPPKEQANKIK